MAANDEQGLQAEHVNETVAAQFLGLKVATLRKWRANGDGPAWHKFGRAVRYRISDLEAFANESRVQAFTGHTTR